VEDGSPRTDPVDCCATPDPRIARHFDRRTRDRLASGRLPALNETSARLRDALADVGDDRPTILELGCGSGALTVELLERGATRATGIDLSPTSIDAARRRVTEAGLAHRATFTIGDAAGVPLQAHDWVVLDRVVCCYPDLDRLLANAVGAARRRIALSAPVSWGWRGGLTRAAIRLEALTAPLRGNPCPNFVHDIRRIEDRLAVAGFGRRHGSVGGMWYLGVFERPSAA
jgi:SAM-dependent methyltransferase